MKGRCRIFLIILIGLIPVVAFPALAQSGGESGGAGTGASGPSASAALSQSPFAGSVPEKPVSGILKISLQDAIDRGLKQNLGLLLSSENIRAARGDRWVQLSALLPNLAVSASADKSQIDLAEFGFNFKIPGAQIPAIVGPFSYFDSRAYLGMSIVDWKAINNARAAARNVKAAQYTYQDARDLVILAAGFSYLQAIAGETRVETADAQVTTAQALYDQASDRLKAGTSPAIDALRAQVELKTRQQQLIAARNDYEIQKLTLARVIGLAPGQKFELTDKSLYEPLAGLAVEQALERAYASRSDYQAALADVHAAEFSRKAAKAGYLPTISFNTDYGVAGDVPNTITHGVFDVHGTLNVPLFQGGRVHGDVLEADARLNQARDRAENLRAQIDADVRSALLNLESSSQQVEVARSNIDLAEQTLSQARDRFAAGVTDTVEVVQAQEAVASAHETYISSLYSFNYAKISLARALGVAEEGVKEYFKGK